jgi:hypothetical protein
MAEIKLSDNFGLNLALIPNAASTFAKYCKSLVSLQGVGKNLAALQNVALQDFPLRSGSIGLSFQDPVALGTADMEMAVSAGVSGELAVYQHGSLFADDSFGDPIDLLPHQAYVSLDIKVSLSGDLASGATLSFGFGAGSDISLANYKPFTTASSEPSFVAALSETLREYCIPLDHEDLQALGTGTIATMQGTGTLKFSATADLLSSVSPLVTVSSPVVPGSLRITEGGSLKVAALFEVSGGYQIRIQKLTQGTVRLGYYKEHGADLRVDVSAQAGISARVGSFDLISTLMGIISSDAKADIDELKRAGLADDQIKAITSAIKSAIERKLELALLTELGLASQKEAAFLYEIELNALDAAGRQAIHDALRGDLSALVADQQTLPSGIRQLQSVFTSIREREYTLKINLLGIYNYISLSRLTLQGTVLYEPESGDLVITDAASAERIRSAMINFGADRDKLRKVLAESFLITAAYRGTRLAAHAPQLKSSCWYFELLAKTDRQAMRDKLDVPQALGLISEHQKQQMLAGTGDFGRSTFYAETTYDDAVTTTLFLDQAGNPRPEDEYDKLGREALSSLIHPGDPDEFRLAPLQDDALWKQMKGAGPAALGTVLPHLGSERIAVIASDYTLIRWWSQAMREMGERLTEVRKFFAQNPDPDPEDVALKALRAELAGSMASVAKNAREEFGHPWGLLAMDRASAGECGATVTVIAGRLTLQLSRPAPSVQLQTATAG